MSTTPESELDLELQLLPAWAKQSPETNRYANFVGRDTETRDRRRDDRGPRGFGGGSRPPRRDGGGFGGPNRGPRPGGPGGPGARPGGPGPRGDRRRDDRGDYRRDDRRDERREPVAPLPEVEFSILPETRGVESIARQIKLTGRAYPLFDIAGLVLKRPERYHVKFEVIKKSDGQVAQKLFVCTLDDTLWLSEAEATAHILAKHFATFYQEEKTATEPPKGVYTFVAQCGISGVILGPPNYHDYQNKLRQLHTERFSRMPFDMFKARVKIVKDEAVVKKWLEEQSWKTEYVCLNVPDALKLASRDDVEKHFTATHLANIVRSVDAHEMPGLAAHSMPCGPLRQLVRRAAEDQRRFPIKVVTILSQQFAGLGLQFFKVNKTVTHVAVARPSYLDLEATPVSDGVRKIVEFLNAHAKCTRKQLIEALAPGPKVLPVTPAPAPAAAPAAEGAAPAAPAEPAAPAPTPEQTAVNGDLHWLIHQGHVIEFANGQIETAKRPAPKPVKPVKAPKPAADTGYVPVFSAPTLLLG